MTFGRREGSARAPQKGNREEEGQAEAEAGDRFRNITATKGKRRRNCFSAPIRSDMEREEGRSGGGGGGQKGA